MAKPPGPDALRAAKLSRVPGVTIGAACERFGVTKAAVARARKTVTTLSLAELALAALTRNGKATAGKLGDLSSIAGWLDYVNHDGCTAEDVRQLLDSLPELLAIRGSRWKLRAPWP